MATHHYHSYGDVASRNFGWSLCTPPDPDGRLNGGTTFESDDVVQSGPVSTRDATAFKHGLCFPVTPYDAIQYDQHYGTFKQTGSVELGALPGAGCTVDGLVLVPNIAFPGRFVGQPLTVEDDPVAPALFADGVFDVTARIRFWVDDELWVDETLAHNRGGSGPGVVGDFTFIDVTLLGVPGWQAPLLVQYQLDDGTAVTPEPPVGFEPGLPNPYGHGPYIDIGSGGANTNEQYLWWGPERIGDGDDFPSEIRWQIDVSECLLSLDVTLLPPPSAFCGFHDPGLESGAFSGFTGDGSGSVTVYPVTLIPGHVPDVRIGPGPWGQVRKRRAPAGYVAPGVRVG